MNKEKLMGYWEKVKAALGKVSKKIWIAIAAVLVLLVIGVVVFLNTRPYATLITGATSEETATVLSWLEEQGVTDYRMEGTGTILVPEAKATGLKAKLLQEQYSSSNSSWSAYFERVSALSTTWDRKAAWQITLMEDMESVIRQFPGVRDVDVKINFGEDNGYILDTNKVVNATASVLLTMENDKYLDDGQADAIRYYISHAVASLSVDDVTIRDTRGNIYEPLADASSSNPAEMSALKLQVERYYSNVLTDQLEKVLFRTYGEDHVSVSARVTAELGDKTINDYEVFLPEFAQDGSTDGAGILSNQFYSWQVRVDDETVAGGLVGTPSNSELPTYVEEGETVQGMLGRLMGEGSREYDNSKRQTQIILTAARVTDINVALSIDTSTAGPVNVNEVREFVASIANIVPDLDMDELTEEEYQFRKAEYLSQRVGVLATAWYHEPEVPAPPTFLETLQSFGIPGWVFFAAIGGLVLFIILLVVIILLVRRGKKKKQEAEQRAIEELLKTGMTPQPGAVELGPDGEPVEPAVQVDENGDPVSGADVMDLHTERSMELRQNIRDYVDENMEVAALLIKSWLKEDVDNG